MLQRIETKIAIIHDTESIVQMWENYLRKLFFQHHQWQVISDLQQALQLGTLNNTLPRPFTHVLLSEGIFLLSSRHSESMPSIIESLHASLKRPTVIAIYMTPPSTSFHTAYSIYTPDHVIDWDPQHIRGDLARVLRRG